MLDARQYVGFTVRDPVANREWHIITHRASRSLAHNGEDEMSTISPTIGRRVWYWTAAAVGEPGVKTKEDPFGTGAPKLHPGVQSPMQAFDAGVIMVHGPECVNLLVTDHYGQQFVVTSAPLRDPNVEADCHGGPSSYATWMPYQTGQAKMSSGPTQRPGDIVLRKLEENGKPVNGDGEATAFVVGNGESVVES